jgi:aldehyde dehydrogenase (NAD+)
MCKSSETFSRYGAGANTFHDAQKGSLSAEQVAPAMKQLRDVFASEKTFSREWRVGQLQAFQRLVTEGRDELCEALRVDLHKDPFEGYATELSLVEHEIAVALDHLDDWMAPKYTKNSALNWPCWSSTQHDPLGVVLIMGAWNYPVQLTLAPIVGAIAGGNCIVVKPGSYAPAASHALSRLLQKYLDPECVRVAEGDRAVTSALLEQHFDKICYTGSGFVGKIVLQAASKHLTPCILELGGKSPCIVDASVNLDHAARRIAWGSFLNSGQTCVRPDFLLLHASIADAFLAKLKDVIKEYYGADAQKSQWYGRVINQKAFARVEGLIKNAKDKVRIGGRVDADDRFVEPTVLDYGADLKAFGACEAMQDEIFGPIMPAVRFSNLEEALSIVKGLPTGKPLALYCYATDSRVIEQVKRRTTSGKSPTPPPPPPSLLPPPPPLSSGLSRRRCPHESARLTTPSMPSLQLTPTRPTSPPGACLINDSLMHLANHELPFGGVGESGMGAYHGFRSFCAFTHEKAVLEKSPMLDQSILLKPLLAARFPPYTPFKKFLVAAFTMPIADIAVNIHHYRMALLFCALAACWASGLRVSFHWS